MTSAIVRGGGYGGRDGSTARNGGNCQLKALVGGEVEAQIIGGHGECHLHRVEATGRSDRLGILILRGEDSKETFAIRNPVIGLVGVRGKGERDAGGVDGDDIATEGHVASWAWEEGGVLLALQVT